MTEARSPDPFLRGNAWPGTDDLPYPRVDPADLDRLPGDTAASARLPVGVRLELVGAADTLELDYRTFTDDLGYRGEGAGTAFTVIAGDTSRSTPAKHGTGTARFSLAEIDRDPAQPIVVYLPEGLRPRVFALRILGGGLEPAPRGPRWLAYGDSITEGWIASGPAARGRRWRRARPASTSSTSATPAQHGASCPRPSRSPRSTPT